MRKEITSLSGLVVTICISSCSPVLYSTVGQNVPLFHEKGEVSLSAGYASTEDGDGVSLQGATALSNHVAVLSSFYSLSKTTNSTDSWSGKGSYFELGGGGFGTFGAKGNYVFEVFAGAGFGKINNEKDVSTANVEFFKPFIQPSIGLTGKWFDVAFTPRIGIVSYTNYRYHSSNPDDDQDFMAFFSQEETTFVFEPGITIRTGYKGIKLQIQYNGTTFSPWETGPNGYEPNINSDFLSIGLNYMISKRFKDQ